MLLLHGCPETSYAWRHQLAALADAGYRAVAPDLRGSHVIAQAGHWLPQEAPGAVNAYLLAFLASP